MNDKKIDEVLRQVLVADKEPERKLNEAILCRVEKMARKRKPMCSK
ncbi:MAG: hypothetical protein NC417_06870 [Candidatus Gastranaerophilales bacterium]|nr:hypothetical protein [Candidatus Gastranaerophilales bacterium]